MNFLRFKGKKDRMEYVRGLNNKNTVLFTGFVLKVFIALHRVWGSFIVPNLNHAFPDPCKWHPKP